MAVRVDARNPKFSVRFLTQRQGPLEAAELQEAVTEIVVSKRLGDAANAFQLTLVPRPKLSARFASFHDLIQPMDFIEIKLWVPPREPKVVLRGFVDTVVQTFDISSGEPQRQIIIAGRNYGKLTLLTKIYPIEPKVAPAIAVFQRVQAGLDEIYYRADRRVHPEGEQYLPPPTPGQPAPRRVFSPTDILTVILEKLYRPQESTILASFGGERPPALLPFFQVDPAEERQLQVFDPQLFASVSQHLLLDVWTLCRHFQHTPWRELFFDEGPVAPYLIYRPTPWLDRNGSRIQEFTETVETVALTYADVIAWTLRRSDHEVFNWFFTRPANAEVFATAALLTGPDGYGHGDFQSNPHLVGLGANAGEIIESTYQRHGLRIFDIFTPYMDFEYHARAEVITERKRALSDMGVIWNQLMRRALDHEALLESGAFTLKGDERLTIGTYMDLDGARYYVEGVVHSFRQGAGPSDGHFVTRVQVTGGRGHLVRTGLGERVMPDYSIGLKVNIDQRTLEQIKALPSDLSKRFAQLQQVLASMPAGAAQQAGLGALGQVRGALASGASTGGVTPEQAKTVQAGLRTVNQAIKQALQERVALYKESRVGILAEIDRLNKDVDTAMAKGEKDRATQLKGEIHGRFKTLQGLGTPELQAHAMREQRAQAQRALGAIGLAVGPGGVPVSPESPRDAGARGSGVGGFLAGSAFQFGRGLLGIGAIGGVGYWLARRTIDASNLQLELLSQARRIGTPDEIGSRSGFLGFTRPAYSIPYLSPTQSVQAHETFTAQAGRLPGDTSRTLGLSRQAALLGLGMGVGPEAGAQFFGGMARVGVGRSEEDQRRLAMLIGEAVVQAQMRGREGEVFASLQEFVELAMRTMTRSPDVEAMLAMQARLAQPGQPGTQGLRGMQILAGAHQAIAGTQLFPGLPDFMRPLLFQTFAREGVTDVFEMERIRSEGLQGKLPSGKFLIEGVFEQARAMGLEDMPGFGQLAMQETFKQTPAGWLALKQMMAPATALTLRQAGTDPDAARRMGLEILTQHPERAGEVTAAFAQGGDVLGALRAIQERPATEMEQRQAAHAQTQQKLTEAAEKATPALTALERAAASAAGALADLVEKLSRRLQGAGLSEEASDVLSLGAVGAGGVWAARRAYRFLGPRGAAGAGGAAAEGAAGWAAGRGFSLFGSLGPAALGLLAGGSEDPGLQEYRRQQYLRSRVLPMRGDRWELEEWARGASGGPGDEAAPARTLGRIDRLRQLAVSQGIPLDVVDRLLAIESSGGTNIKVGPAGERGPLQILPSTAAGFLKQPTVDPNWLHGPEGDRVAVGYLAQLWDKYQDPQEVAAAWNAGEPAVASAQREARRTGRSWTESVMLPKSTRERYLPAFQRAEPGLGSIPGAADPETPMDPGVFNLGLDRRLQVGFDDLNVIIRSEETGDELGRGQATPRVESGESYAGPTVSATAP